MRLNPGNGDQHPFLWGYRQLYRDVTKHGGSRMQEQDGADSISRRTFLGKSSAMLAAAAALPMVAAAQQRADKSGDTHTGVNEQQPGPRNQTLEESEPDSNFPPSTDAGGQP